jgi:hypothetical protein
MYLSERRAGLIAFLIPRWRKMQIDKDCRSAALYEVSSSLTKLRAGSQSHKGSGGLLNIRVGIALVDF